MPDKFVIPTPKIGPFPHGPDSQRHAEVPKGALTKHAWRSEIFPGTERDYWVYIPVQYTPDRPANVMVFQDGASYVSEESSFRTPVVFDNLIHKGKIPVTIGIFINPWKFTPVAADKEGVSNRSFEYDSLSDQYTRFLLEEILPVVADKYNLTTDADGRGICGMSSGGICSFTVAWHRPDAFRKVLSHVGSFTDIRGGHVYPTLIRKTPPNPIRVFLQGGTNDLNTAAGNWPLTNLEMAAALNFAGYDYRLEFGDGAHDGKHGGAILPESLIWLWK